MAPSLNTVAVVVEQPERLALTQLDLCAPGPDDVVVDIDYSGISTGTERLLWSGRMPDFPGMGYPLVPGYESVGRIRAVGSNVPREIGETVFVPGARCYGPVRGLFGGASCRVVVPSARAISIDAQLGERGVLLALAATAYHALTLPGVALPELIVGHGVLGRLIARIAYLLGGSPIVWERDPRRVKDADGYQVLHPAEDRRRDYGSICDVSGDASLIDDLVLRLAPGGEIVLAGFYCEPIAFAFAPAFMREARLRIAAEWKPADIDVVSRLVATGALSLDGLITHRHEAPAADTAYRTAFGDSTCLKMVLDWRTCQ